MTKFVTSVKNFLVSEDGPTAVEYAIMLALIVIVCIGAVQNIGKRYAPIGRAPVHGMRWTTKGTTHAASSRSAVARTVGR